MKSQAINKNVAKEWPVSWSRICLLIPMVVGGLLGHPQTFAADVFDKHDFSIVKQAAGELPAIPKITMQEASKLKPLSATISTPCLVVKTSEGNYAKMLVSWGFRKNGEERIPVLLLERFVTYRGDRPDMTAATGRDILLFAGFEFDFDIGQVVPPKSGGDISFSAESILEVVPPAVLVSLPGSLLPPAEASTRPVSGAEGSAQDFAGDWTINADNRWNGEWSLKVDDEGRITGKFVSSESQNTYDISGNVSALPHQARIEIFLANAQISAEAYLWTKDHNDMAGVVTVAGRKFGFYGKRVVAEKAAEKPDASVSKDSAASAHATGSQP